MKAYSVEINHSYRHGKWGACHPHIVTLTISASSKKAAREEALNSMIGKVAGDYGFPIDFSHAPEAYQSEGGWWTMKGIDAERHIINEYDIAQNGVFSIQVNQIEEA